MSGRVIAIANGGLKHGFAGISWAILFKDIKWDNPSSGGRLKALAQLNPNVLFAADAIPVASADEIRDDLCGQLSWLVAESQRGFLSVVGDPLADNVTAFKSKVELSGAISSYIYPNQYIGYEMFETEKKLWAESQYYKLVTKLTACFPSWERKDWSGRYNSRSYLFRQNAKSPVIEIYYNLEPIKIGKPYTLRLHIYTLGDSYRWNSYRYSS